MQNLTCPALALTAGEVATICGADAHVLDVCVETGEIDAWCIEHRANAGGRGYVVIETAGPLHSTSLHTR